MRPFDDTSNIRLPVASSWRQCERQIKEFEKAWQGGEEPAIDDYLVAAPEDREALLIELVHIDLEFRLKTGREVGTHSYFSRFPELQQNEQAAMELLEA